MARERRRRGEGSVYQLPDGAWRVQMPLPDGRRRTKRCATEREARLVRAEWLREVERGRSLERSRQAMTLGQWLTYWLDEVKPGDPRIRQVTIEEYRRRVDNQIRPFIGDVPLSELKPSHVRRLHKALREWKVTSRDGSRIIRIGLSPTTIGHVHAVLRAALRDALNDDLIDANPAASVRSPTPSGKHHAQPSEDDIRRILAAPMTAREQARVMVALFTSLRQGEALALLWADVHETDPVPHLLVTASLRRVTGVGMVRMEPKSAASRRAVPLSPGTAGALAAWRAESGGVGYVFGSAKDATQGASQQWDHRQWEKVLQRAGVPDLPLHGARGAFATTLGAMHYNAREIADLMGHAQVSTTHEHYMRSLTTQRAAAVAELEARFD